MTRNLFLFLCDALWHTGISNDKKQLSEVDSVELFLLAERQAVSGLVVDALFRNDIKMPQHLVFESVGLLEQIKQRSRDVNKGAVRLHKLFGQENVDYIIVKGQAVATYYPDELLRQSGDLDYYCDRGHFPFSLQVIKDKWNVDAEISGSEKHCHFDYYGVTFEGHFSLITLYSKKRDSYWQELLETDKGTTVLLDSAEIKTLSPTLHTLYIFLHLYHHLLSLGVGLRQYCDLAVMLHYAKEQIDMNALRTHLQILRMDKAFRACGSILVNELGLPEDELGYKLDDRDIIYGKKMLKVVMYRGNMGHYNKRNGFCGWKHKLEAIGIKISHFVKFMPLAQKYSCGWLWHEIKRNL